MVAVLALCAAGIAAVSTQLRCIDAAREAARLAARGDLAATAVAAVLAPPGASMDVRRDGGYTSQGSAVDRPCCPDWSSSGRRSPRLSRVSDDTGVATVMAAVLIAALVVIALGGIQLGAAEVARHRAQAAADLAALAAAGGLSLGSDAACQQADNLAATMRATVRDCHVEQLDVVVSVMVRTAGWIGVEARAASRAGPAARPRN